MNALWGKAIPPGLIGESWEISPHSNGLSHVAEGPMAGKSLPDLMAEHAPALVGPAMARKYGQNFPILIKLIDVNARASLQVHPDDVCAMRLEKYPMGKTEAWFIISAQPNADCYLGFKPGVNRETFLAALSSGRIQTLLRAESVSPHDCFLVPAGMAHACGNGIMLLEIQQCCDLTYRVYDWDRSDEQGRRRALHIDQVLAAIDFAIQPRRTRPHGPANHPNPLLSCAYFDLLTLTLNRRVDLPQPLTCLMGVVIQGDARLTWEDASLALKPGDSFIIPHGIASVITSENCVIVFTVLK